MQHIPKWRKGVSLSMGGELSGYNTVQHFLALNIAEKLHAGLKATINFKLQFLAIHCHIHSEQI